MHIPPYHKKQSWQRFFLGAFFGGVIAYCILIYMYGTMYEELYEENLTLRTQLQELKNQNEALLQAQEDSEEKEKAVLKINKIEVNISNAEDLLLDRLIVHELQRMIKHDLNHVIGQDVRTLSESTNLLIAAIENKSYTIENFTYKFEITQLTISQTLKLTMNAKMS